MTLRRYLCLKLLLNRLLVNIHDMILAGTQSDGLGMVDGMGAVLLVNAVQQVSGVVLGGHLLVVDDVDAGLVKGDGVGGSQDAVVLKLHNTIEAMGTVIDAQPNAMFKVRLDNDFEILAHISGKIRMNYIRILPGDRVKVELSPYDLTRGRITWREK